MNRKILEMSRENKSPNNKLQIMGLIDDLRKRTKGGGNPSMIVLHVIKRSFYLVRRMFPTCV